MVLSLDGKHKYLKEFRLQTLTISNIYLTHGTRKRTEIEKKMSGSDTHIFWFGIIPQGQGHKNAEMFDVRPGEKMRFF